MTNRYGRPRTYTKGLKVRLPEHVLAELFLFHPELFSHEDPGAFRYGALSSYITELVTRDIQVVRDRVAHNLREQQNAAKPPIRI